MNIQEILNNLTALEKELQNIKSARAMAEETIGSCRDTQKEIVHLIDGLGQVNASLIAIAEGLKKQDDTFAGRIKQSILKINQALSFVNTAFQANCDKSNASFNENISNAIESLRHEIDNISGAFTQGNENFKHHLQVIS